MTGRLRKRYFAKDEQKPEETCHYCGKKRQSSDYPHYCSRQCYLDAFKKYRNGGKENDLRDAVPG